MNLSEIETFLMIVKTKNITKTAENLFLSQPTVSHRPVSYTHLDVYKRQY